VDSNLKVILLSLGTVHGESGQLLSDVCRKACEKEVIIVAAATSLSEQIYPATLEAVIGVTWDRQCRESDLVFFRDGSIEFGTCGHPRPLPEMGPTSNFSGSSLVGSHVTARAAFTPFDTSGQASIRLKKQLLGIYKINDLRSWQLQIEKRQTAPENCVLLLAGCIATPRRGLFRSGRMVAILR
jgi:hypothetical protein